MRFLLELQERGFDPDYVVADAGNALRAAQAGRCCPPPLAAATFSTLMEVSEVVTKLENRALTAT